MAEEEKQGTLLYSSILERRRKCRKELESKKECRQDILVRQGKSMRRKEMGEEECLLKKTLIKEAYKHRVKSSKQQEDSVPALGVSIGGFSRLTREDVTVTALFLYKRRRLHWEIVEGTLLHLIDVKWDDIAGLELKLNESGLACLTVKVNRPPRFVKYIPEFKSWLDDDNFIDEDEIKLNLLPIYVLFKPGTIDESYEKFLNYRKEEEVLKEKNTQRFQKRLLLLEKRETLRKNLPQFLENNPHRQLGKEENK